jgi:hypothetical protein
MKKGLVYLLLFISITNVYSQKGEVLSKVNDFLSTLDSKQKSKCQYTYDDPERVNWWFVPHVRNGLSFHDMDQKQTDAAMALLKVSLSDQGYQKAKAIISNESVLKEIEGRAASDNYRDPLNYYFTIFGTPSKEMPWGWRIEGHHLSLNYSSASGLIDSSTPSFMGANPGIVLSGPNKGGQILKQETDLGFSLVNSFAGDQLQTVRFSETALPEIVSGNDRKAKNLEPKGISYNSMNEQQKKTFMQLLDVFVKNYQLGFGRKLMEKIKKAGIENLSFAWAGSLQPGAGHYYRIQGPMLLIEYDNTQNNANHVHTAVRDLTNDFAEDILREHYQKEHH